MDTYSIQFGGHRVDVLHEGKQSSQALEFLFGDIHGEHVNHIDKTFSLVQENQYWHLSSEGETKIQTTLLEDVANILMGEVVFHLIEKNTSYMAVHAGYVSDQHGGILIPGESGNGKSSLTFWMTLNNYTYHTDELILLSIDSNAVRSFTRPFNIKNYGLEPIQSLVNIDNLGENVMRGSNVHMLAHRAINPDYSTTTPPLKKILFPLYNKDASNTLTPISKASAGIELMKSNVIARNLAGHGFDQMLSIVKGVKAYRLDYNDFAVLPELLSQMSD